MWLIGAFALAATFGSYSGRLWRPGYSYGAYFKAHFSKRLDGSDFIWAVIGACFGVMLIKTGGPDEAWHFLPFCCGAVAVTRSDFKTLEIHEVHVFLIGITSSIVMLKNDRDFADWVVGLMLPLSFLLSQCVALLQNKITKISVGDLILMISIIPLLTIGSILWFLGIFIIGLIAQKIMTNDKTLPLAPVLSCSASIICVLMSLNL